MLYERPENIGDSFSTTMVVKNGASETIYVGDQQVMNRDNGAAVFTNVKDDIGYIGRYPVGSHSENWYNQSDVAEIMIYNRALGLAEIQQINAYLNEKYSEKPEVTLESITVSGPTKTQYEIGDELDLTGLVVTAHYSDGSEAAVEDYEVSGFDSSTAGEKTITVTYQDKTTTFTVNVKEAAPVVTLESITVSGPNKTEYEIGEELDLTGLVVIAHYSDGSYQEVTDYEVSGFDSAAAGEKTVTVTYQGETVSFKITVKEDTASSEQPGESGKPDDNQSSSQPDDTQSSSGSQDDQNIQTGDSMAPYVGTAVVLILLRGLGIAIALIIRRRRLG